MKKLKILVFAKLHHPTCRFLKDFIFELRKYADVQIWNKDGWEINYVLKALKKRGGFVPDFIFHYDFVYNYTLSPTKLTWYSALQKIFSSGCSLN